MSSSPGSPSPSERELDDAILAALFAESPIGLHVLDTELRLVRYNSAARHVDAFPIHEFLGCRMPDMLRTYDAERAEIFEAMVREVLETGEPRRDVLLTLRSRSKPQVEITVSASWFRLQDSGGRPLGVAAALVDVTDRQRAQARLTFLDRASARIGTTLDLFGTAQELADATVPGFADTVVVDILDPVLRGEAPESGPLTEGLPLRRAGWASVGETTETDAQFAGVVNTYQAGTPHRAGMTDLRPRLNRRRDPGDDWLDGDSACARLLRESGVHSMILVPMCARGVVLGLASFYRWRHPEQYSEDDLALATHLAARTALCLDNARLYNRDRSAARIMRLTLRPREVPVHTAVETAHTYLPSGSGGDWFDVIPLSGARVALVVGDIAAMGLHAAVGMGELRAAIGALSALDLAPDELLERLHALVTQLSGQEPALNPAAGRGAGTTCLYLVYDPVTRVCTMAGAGHPPPVVVGPDGTVRVAELPQGPPLGLGLADYRATTTELAEGSVLVLCNAALLPEGAPERWEGRLDQVRAALTGGSGSLQERCDTLLATLAPGRPEHDAVLLLARTRALGPDRLAHWTLSPDAESAAEARRLTSERLSYWGLDDLRDTAELVVSELVTNAVRYSDGPIELRLIRDRSLICEVSDTSSTAPQLRQAAEDDEHGRGLFITAQLTARWGTRPTRRGKIIWAEQSLPGPAADGPV